MKILNTYLSSYLLIRPSILYSDDVRYLPKDFTATSGLYAMTSSSSLRYDVSRCRFVTSTDLMVTLVHNGESYEHRWDMVEFFHDMPHVRQQFPNRDAIRRYMNDRRPGVVLDTSTDVLLRFTTPLAHDFVFEIFVYQLLNALNIDGLISNEIVYFGLSRTSLIDRVATHNKWGEITAQRSRNHDTLVYFFKTSSYGIELPSHRMVEPDLDADTILSLSEMHYIWALKPRFNQMYKDRIPLDSTFLSRGRAHGYDAMRIEIELDGQVGFVSGTGLPLSRRIEMTHPWALPA